ncbi:trimethyltridecatetraene synthase-like isoform X2 [Panicum virgatum]|nr:trimethyltridecatetraene synthase-like isoform X2 [Panicum virgatum]XP_039814886.1 trimethyltridecatetraene synthase-like isoform X2 [Panicum virgatum]XP_039814887.1 trimethyltridecatetraene synthase-like isoform X2 [Panicum virgatum]XP_039814888.1 trimethyltridecatetraene synthase-like isoform X2 [Panicum virgatum]
MEMEVPPPWLSSLAVLLATALFLAAVLRRRGSRNKHYNLPPGPRPRPVIGNLNLIGPLPHRSIRELSARYGPLMSLRFGSFPVVVGSSVDAAEFFLKTHDLAFLDRPRMACGKHTVYNYSGMLWSHYGAYWRQLRKLWLTELLSARQLRRTELVRAEEVRAMLRDIRAGAGAAVAVKEHLLMATLNVVSRMVLGRKYVGEQGAGAAAAVATPEEFRWMIEEIFFLNGALHIGDLVPWLGWFDPNGYVARMKRLGKMFDRFVEHVLREHEDRRRREGPAFVPTDMVDQLLELAGDPCLDVPIDRDGVKASILELITGGTDSSSVTVEWAMSELLRKPEVLAKVTEELDRVVGRGRLVGEGDIPSLPYLDAVVKETMRLHPVAPLLIPRVSREDTAVAGYDIPRGTRVLVNVWAIGRDPAVWGDAAEEFRPERFVGGEEAADVKGQDLRLLPFGSGRRMCPAHGLGLRMVQLVLANLVHGFAWRLPDGVPPEKLSMEEKFGISVSRRDQLKALPEPKLPGHLY